LITVYTDGSSSLKTGWCGWAAIARYNGLETRVCGWARETNQFAELYAIVYVLRRLPKHEEAEIISDSQYAIRSLTDWRRRWERNGFRNAEGREVCHADLIKEGHRLIDGFDSLSFRHVRGHQGNEGNEAADCLAVGARKCGESTGGTFKLSPAGATAAMLDGVDVDTGIRYEKVKKEKL